MEYFVWDVDPVIFSLGSVQLRWYGLLFVGSFFVGIAFLQWVYRQEGKDGAVLENLLIYLIIGVIVGSRIAHCLFYEPEYYLSNPLEILYVWKGGLASHGGMIGAIIALYLFVKRYNQSFFWLLARGTMAGMITAAAVRIGNFFNSEILGLPTTVPWAVIFARVDTIPRHPVQLYEAFSYMMILGLLFIIYRKATTEFATKVLTGLFFLALFSVRFALEFTKSRQALYATDFSLSIGQMLSLPFILLGIVWIVWALYTTPQEQRWRATT